MTDVAVRPTVVPTTVAPLRSFAICDAVDGRGLGRFWAASPRDALDGFARVEGYRSFEVACRARLRERLWVQEL